MGDYTYDIDFSGIVLVIWGGNATLDAAGKGQFFTGDGSKGIKTSLELKEERVCLNDERRAVRLRYWRPSDRRSSVRRASEEARKPTTEIIWNDDGGAELFSGCEASVGGCETSVAAKPEEPGS